MICDKKGHRLFNAQRCDLQNVKTACASDAMHWAKLDI